MKKQFFLSWLVVYAFNSISGFVIHHVILGKTYEKLMPVLHSENIKSKLWAFIIASIASSFFFSFIYQKWQKRGTVKEGLQYGFYISVWIGLSMALSTYASTALIPFSLALQWFLYTVVQYSIAGLLLALVYNYKISRETGFGKRS